MNELEIHQLGDELYNALRDCNTIKPFTDRNINITLDAAYHISQRMLNQRIVLDGEKVIGKKIGITSEAVQSMFNVNQPDFGFLTDSMQYDNHSEIPIAGNMIQPKAEAEIAFRLKGDLVGPGVTEADVLAATESIIPCFEIVDSRIDNWKIKIEDTVADNASCGAFVLGKEEVNPHDYDLPNLKVIVKKNGQFISEGLGNAVQGNPLTAVTWLANTLGEYGIQLNAGEVILSGSLVPLEPVVAGDEMSLEFQGVGSVTVKFC